MYLYVYVSEHQHMWIYGYTCIQTCRRRISFSRVLILFWAWVEESATKSLHHLICSRIYMCVYERQREEREWGEGLGWGQWACVRRSVEKYRQDSATHTHSLSHTRTHIHTRTRAHTHICTHTHTYTHMHTKSCRQSLSLFKQPSLTRSQRSSSRSVLNLASSCIFRIVMYGVLPTYIYILRIAYVTSYIRLKSGIILYITCCHMSRIANIYILRIASSYITYCNRIYILHIANKCYVLQKRIAHITHHQHIHILCNVLWYITYCQRIHLLRIANVHVYYVLYCRISRIANVCIYYVLPTQTYISYCQIILGIANVLRISYLINALFITCCIVVYYLLPTYA